MKWVALIWILLLIPAASAIDCNSFLTKDTILTQDLVCPDAALITDASGLTIDCKGHTIIGSSASNGIEIKHDDTTIVNCNVRNFFTGINIRAVENVRIKNTLVTNASTGLHAEQSGKLLLDTVNLRRNFYHDLYLKDVKGFTKVNLKADKQTIIDDTREPEDPIQAQKQNYTFRSEPIAVIHPRIEATVQRLNLSLEEYRYAKESVALDMVVQQQEQSLEYTIRLTAQKPIHNVTVMVATPKEYVGYQFITSMGAHKKNLLLTYPSVDLEENETQTFTFEVSTVLDRSQWTLPVAMVFSPKPQVPSARTAQWVLFIWFVFAASLFLFTKKFLLKQPVTVIEQLILLAGVLAIWALSYRFTIEALQLTKDFIMICLVSLLILHYLYFIYRNRQILANL